MNDIISILNKIGPARSSKVATLLQTQFGLSAVNARQRISRASVPILKFPISLLPNNEAFIYLRQQRKEEWFWVNLLQALRETNSIYGIALDALLARGGVVTVEEFQVVSGAPIALKRQVSTSLVIKRLVAAGAIERKSFLGEECIQVLRSEIGLPNHNGYRPRQLVEKIILDGLREWAKKLGFASYNRIAIRGEVNSKRVVGAFKWDLTGPSYLLALKGEKSKPGFFVADVFSKETLDENEIKYFVRKIQLLKASLGNSRFFAVLVARGFTTEAYHIGVSEGIVLATPDSLFGFSIARAIKTLLDTLHNAAAIASSNPDKLLKLIDQLKDIEGAAGNLRGVLFELICAYIAKVQGGNIDIGILATDSETGKTRDIDVLSIIGKAECIVIECKGKNPGGTVAVEEVQKWLESIPIIVAFLREQQRFSEIKIRFELWTSGDFQPDALHLLSSEKEKRKKFEIGWKNGNDVFNVSKNAKERTINNALREHFIYHPLAK